MKPSTKLSKKKNPSKKTQKNDYLNKKEDGWHVRTQITLTDKDERFLPKYKDEKATCVELVAKMPPMFVGGVTMPPKVLLNHRASAKIQTGIRVAVPQGFKICVAIMEEYAIKGLILSNSPAQISGSEIIVHVINVGRELVEIKDGDKIALCWIEPVYRFDWELVDSLDKNEN